jgi:hypothetical protein
MLQFAVFEVNGLGFPHEEEFPHNGLGEKE